MKKTYLLLILMSMCTSDMHASANGNGDTGRKRGFTWPFGKKSKKDKAIKAKKGVLHLSKQGLTDLAILEQVENPEAVITLDLSQNDISNLPAAGFEQFTNLQHLFLNGNNLIEIGEQAFNGLTKLKTLDLSGNDINKFHPEAFLFDLSKNLRSINLRLNRMDLSKLPDKLFANLGGLLFLNIAGNLNQGYVDQNLDKLGLTGRADEIRIMK